MSTENTELPPKFVNLNLDIEYSIIRGLEHDNYGLLVKESTLAGAEKMTLYIFSNEKKAEKAQKSLEDAIKDPQDRKGWSVHSAVHQVVDTFII